MDRIIIFLLEEDAADNKVKYYFEYKKIKIKFGKQLIFSCVMIHNVSLLIGLCLALAVVFLGLYLGLVKDASGNKTKLILYLFVTGILISLLSLLGTRQFIRLSAGFFIVSYAWMLIIGILHLWLFEKIIPLENKNGGRILFTIAACCFGYVLFILSFKVFFKAPFPRLFFLPAFFFIVPTFVIIAFNYFEMIPVKVYKVWLFPAPGTLADPSDSEMTDPLIVNFEIRKQSSDDHTVFKAKAPRSMKLGRLFYFFIMDYNSRHPDNPIVISGGENEPFKWSFCLSAGLLAGKRRLDPEMSVSKNGIKENASVICERITL
jgi:hypothetical protein